MKRILLSALVSLLYLPLIMIGFFVGAIIGPYIAVIADLWHTAGFIVNLLPDIVMGFLGGYLSAICVSQIYREFHFISAIILPIILQVIAILGAIGTEGYERLLPYLIAIIAYIYCLKNADNL